MERFFFALHSDEESFVKRENFFAIRTHDRVPFSRSHTERVRITFEPNETFNNDFGWVSSEFLCEPHRHSRSAAATRKNIDYSYLVFLFYLHLDLNWRQCRCCYCCMPLFACISLRCHGHAAWLFVVFLFSQIESATTINTDESCLIFHLFGILECSSTACRAFNYAVVLSAHTNGYTVCMWTLAFMVNERFVSFRWYCILLFYALETTLPLISERISLSLSLWFVQCVMQLKCTNAHAHTLSKVDRKKP